MQLTLTGTLVGLALGQLVIGPLSDPLGRRRPLLAGTALHVAASLLVLVAPSIAVLGVLRVLQGVGAAAAASSRWRWCATCSPGAPRRRCSPGCSWSWAWRRSSRPTIGGELLRFTSWRGVFAVLAAYGVVLLALGRWGLRETLPPERRRAAALRATAATYRVAAARPRPTSAWCSSPA